MKTILVTAYAINPYKGSEDGMGWNFVLQIARYHKVIAVTRINNGPQIEHYQQEHPGLQHLYDNIRFLYFDWPYFLRFWKKGPLLSLIYFYGWQLVLPAWLLLKREKMDIAHNLNFHNDWTPSFLWLLGKPLVWGPIGHHPAIPREFIVPAYGKKEYRKDRFLWNLKKVFWFADPFLRLTARKAGKVLCMNSQPPGKLPLKKGQYRIIPSVAAEDILITCIAKPKGYIVLSAGRFVALKGFDLTIRAFADFYHRLSSEQQKDSRLILVGSGPALPLLESIIEEEKIEQVVKIINWMPRQELQAIYQNAHVFLFPSHEGAGMVVAEAMSYGLPVLCLDNSGPGEFLHPLSSLKVPYVSYEGTIARLADKLTELHSGIEYYTREKELALQRFHDYFRWDVRGEQLKEVYENIISG